MRKHEGYFISHWVRRDNPEPWETDIYMKALDFSQGSLTVLDRTSTPINKLFAPAPNVVVVYLIGSEAELLSIAADPNHTEIKGSNKDKIKQILENKGLADVMAESWVAPLETMTGKEAVQHLIGMMKAK